MSEEQVAQSTPTSLTSPPPQRLVIVPAKSAGVAILLPVLFGPLGLLYSTVMGAIVMFVVNIVIAMVTMGFGLILTWPICGIWAFVAVKSHNKKLLEGQM